MWQKTSGWGRRRRRHCVARVTVMPMMATGEGGGEGEHHLPAHIYGIFGGKKNQFDLFGQNIARVKTAL
jgi:hypothetical protein